MSILNKEPKKITVKHYVLYFKTLDGVEHECTKFNYIDTEQINCPVTEWILIDNKDFLFDDKFTYYPMSAIAKIWSVCDKQTEVNEREYGIWYKVDGE